MVKAQLGASGGDDWGGGTSVSMEGSGSYLDLMFVRYFRSFSRIEGYIPLVPDMCTEMTYQMQLGEVKVSVIVLRLSYHLLYHTSLVVVDCSFLQWTFLSNCMRFSGVLMFH